jgi:GTP cyclohydrolase-4
MKKQYKDPVNYKLTQSDVNNPGFSNFLDELTDVPSSESLKPYSIDKAGIAEQSAYITIKAIDDNDIDVTMLINVCMQVELKGHRGIHMSRCEEALFSLVDKTHTSLDAFTEKLSILLLNVQDSKKAFVSAEGTYIHKRLTKMSKKQSYDKMTLRAISTATPKGTQTNIGMSAFNMTGCPCTETFTKFAVVPKLKKAGFDLNQISDILDITVSGTHTQRGLATINIDKTSNTVTYLKLYEILDNSCHLVYELLKRPDEHELVVRVLRKPQFTEDVVRDIAGQLVHHFKKDIAPTSKVFISSQLYDSIHIHDVYTEIEKKFSELVAEDV